MKIGARTETVAGSQAAELAWSQASRRSGESGMDLDSSVYLRCFLFEDFDSATSWSDLVTRLCAKGFDLAFDRGRLILVNRHTGVDLCTCRYLGFSFAELARVLGKPCVHGGSGRIVAASDCGPS